MKKRTGRRKRLKREFLRGLRELIKYGIRFSVEDGELFIRYEDFKKYSRLCDEGKLPRSVC